MYIYVEGNVCGVVLFFGRTTASTNVEDGIVWVSACATLRKREAAILLGSIPR